MTIQKVMKLDILSIKPYLTIKNLVLLVGLSILYSVLSQNILFVASMTQIFSIMFASYPFLVGEESGIDPLYKMFGIKADEVVKGRYGVGILFVLTMLLVGALLLFFISIFYPQEHLLESLLVIIPSTFILSTLVIFIQYPLYFKYGYTKGKQLAMIPFLLIAIIMLVSNLYQKEMVSFVGYLADKKILLMVIVVAFWLISLGISFKLSKKYYTQREF
ncbi:ABC-2 transporter permease [Facklamia sp. DSM 111018]|uniref:ABC-2 transporter permease n=1 Tax=Facklamia lactis TaxID=2749967 RepID=A0ABS0LP18_9LACT|nr:ABC-2 transporter permease [Facklamia lactis]MBG9985838.1 ABC-2 transporter permease [Facklamia lactis]